MSIVLQTTINNSQLLVWAEEDYERGLNRLRDLLDVLGEAALSLDPVLGHLSALSLLVVARLASGPVRR